MKGQVLLVIFALLIALSYSQNCIDGVCQKMSDLSGANQKIVNDAQNQIRKWFWYYLRGARLLYATIIESSDQYFLFFIHRNIVGTFQTVSAVDKSTLKQNIKNLVRLGAGASVDVQNPSNQPIDIIPAIISIQLKPDEYLVNRNDNGKFQVVGGNFVDTTPPEPMIRDAQTRLPEIQRSILGKYPQYLSGSKKIGDEIILTTERVYFLITFTNPQGLFLAIGSEDTQRDRNINTFVRLGKGLPANPPQRINLDANVIQLQ